jgi:hypothetical protein
MSVNNIEVAELAAVRNIAENASDDFSAEVQAQTQYTAEDLSRARAQEKEKLYPAMDKMKEELSALKKERDESLAKDAERRAQRVARDSEAAKKKDLEDERELGFKELLAKKEAELQSQIDIERAEREKALTLLDRERQFQDLQAFRQQRLEAERDNIIPELIDLIRGDSKDDVERSITELKEKSARIFDSVSQAATQSRKEMVGTRVTVPANGPLDNDSENNSLSSDDLRNMSMADYAKNRTKLLGSTGNNRGQGLFG